MAAFYGQNTDIDAAAERLLTASTVVNYGITVKALPGNTGVVYVGLDSTVTTSTGYPLSAGEEKSFDVALLTDRDAYSLYVIASAANQGAAYFGV